jgi:hypothetical protein
VAEEERLLGPRFDQASQPDKGFVLDPLVAPVDGLFLLGTEPAAFVLPGGALANYQAVVGEADNRSYVHSSNWGARDAPIRRRIVEESLAALPPDLRHTAASVLIMRGTPLTEVAQILGHAGPHVTAAVYAHLVPRAGRTALEEAEDFYGGQERPPAELAALPDTASAPEAPEPGVVSGSA